MVWASASASRLAASSSAPFGLAHPECWRCRLIVTGNGGLSGLRNRGELLPAGFCSNEIFAILTTKATRFSKMTTIHSYTGFL
jgi:hypothetical protein